MKRMTTVPKSSLSRSSPTVAAHLRGELPRALQGPGPNAPLVQRHAISPALLDDLCEERPEDCRFWDVLRQPQARVVATGQQPGALGGSLLVLYKAATAIALAQSLQEANDIPVVPVFWNATDDVDFDEIAKIGWHSDQDGLFYLQLPRQDRRAESFIGDLPAQGDREALNALLQQVPSQWAERLQGFDGDSSMDHGTWVGHLLRCIFPQLLVLDARSVALRRHAAPLFASYLNQLPAARQAVETQIDALQELGHKRVLSPASVQMGLFLTENNSRQKTSDPDVLLKQLQDNPEGLSPNVTLRPLVQDQLLPTVAAVVGPAELGYHLELQSLRALLQVPQPALVSRLSGTILPASLWHAVQRHDIDVTTWLRSPQEAMQETGRQLAAKPIQQAETLFDTFDRSLQQEGLAAAEEPALRRVRKGLQPIRDRLIRDIAESHTKKILEQSPGLQKAVELVQPGTRMQERVLAGLWLIAQQGDSAGERLIDDAAAHLQALSEGREEHALWVIEDSPSVAQTAQQGES